MRCVFLQLLVLLNGVLLALPQRWCCLLPVSVCCPHRATCCPTPKRCPACCSPRPDVPRCPKPAPCPHDYPCCADRSPAVPPESGRPLLVDLGLPIATLDLDTSRADLLALSPEVEQRPPPQRLHVLHCLWLC